MRLLGFISLRSARLLLQKQKTPVLTTAASGAGTTGDDLGLNKSRDENRRGRRRETMFEQE